MNLDPYIVDKICEHFSECELPEEKLVEAKCSYQLATAYMQIIEEHCLYDSPEHLRNFAFELGKFLIFASKLIDEDFNEFCS